MEILAELIQSLILLGGGIISVFLFAIAVKIFKNRHVPKTYTRRLVGVNTKTNEWAVEDVLSDDYIEQVLK